MAGEKYNSIISLSVREYLLLNEITIGACSGNTDEDKPVFTVQGVQKSPYTRKDNTFKKIVSLV